MNKKIKCMLLTFLLMAAMCIPAFAEVVTEYNGYEASEIIEYYQFAVDESSISLTVEEIEEMRDSYESNGYSEIAAGYGQLAGIRDDIQGAELTDSRMETLDEGDYPLQIVYTLENDNGEFTCTLKLDEGFNAMALSYEKVDNQTLGQKMGRAALNTVIGIVIVFAVLILISFLISLLKYAPALVDKFTGKGKKQEQTAEPGEPVTVVAAAPAQEDLTDDTELVAVISAAIAASMGAESTDGFVVRTIKKRKW